MGATSQVATYSGKAVHDRRQTHFTPSNADRVLSELIGVVERQSVFMELHGDELRMAASSGLRNAVIQTAGQQHSCCYGRRSDGRADPGTVPSADELSALSRVPPAWAAPPGCWPCFTARLKPRFWTGQDRLRLPSCLGPPLPFRLRARGRGDM